MIHLFINAFVHYCCILFAIPSSEQYNSVPLRKPYALDFGFGDLIQHRNLYKVFSS